MSPHRDIIISPTRPRHHHRRSSKGGHHHHHQQQQQQQQQHRHHDNPAYIIEFLSQGRRQWGIKNGDELRLEIAAQGGRRVIVVRGGWNGVGDVLAVVLSDGERKSRRRKQGIVGWEYPSGEGDESVRMMSVGVWDGGRIPVVMIGAVSDVFPSIDGSSSAWSSGRAASYGMLALEQVLWENLGDGQPVEDVVAEFAYDQWLTFLDSLGYAPPKDDGGAADVLWKAMAALERNASSARETQRHARTAESISPQDWSALADRVHRRLQLSLLTAPPLASSTVDKDANGRSLDRIAYLGGVLLPITVVSGILAIEGDYGPSGPSFWVFWVAAGITSFVAILVIYADHVRTLDVWIEDAAAGVMEAGLVGVYDDGHAHAHGLARGRDGRLWRRKELGWMGAVKKMSGWYRLRGSPELEFRMPGLGERMRRMI